jgi:selenoprotein W-related protein
MDEPTTPEATSGPRVEITYCTQCRWLLRATWLASELLTSFGTEIGEVALRPGTGGIFRVRVGDEVVWDRKEDGGFPDLGPLKRLVRDRVAPGRSLGHTDRVVGAKDAGAVAEPPL